jgi:hypothetical protein
MNIQTVHAETRRRGEDNRARSAQRNLAEAVAISTAEKNSAPPRLRVQILRSAP